jgi:heme-degrading monooxygenase HmoA
MNRLQQQHGEQQHLWHGMQWSDAEAHRAWQRYSLHAAAGAVHMRIGPYSVTIWSDMF